MLIMWLKHVEGNLGVVSNIQQIRIRATSNQQTRWVAQWKEKKQKPWWAHHYGMHSFPSHAKAFNFACILQIIGSNMICISKHVKNCQHQVAVVVVVVCLVSVVKIVVVLFHIIPLSVWVSGSMPLSSSYIIMVWTDLDALGPHTCNPNNQKYYAIYVYSVFPSGTNHFTIF